MPKNDGEDFSTWWIRGRRVGEELHKVYMDAPIEIKYAVYGSGEVETEWCVLEQAWAVRERLA